MELGNPGVNTLQSNRSDKVISQYKRHKLNISVLAQIKRYVAKMEAEDAVERRLAWIGTAVVLILLAALAYFYASLSDTTLS